MIDTTNVMEGFNWQPRKATKMPTDSSLLKMLYLVWWTLQKMDGERMGMGYDPLSAECIFC